MNKPDYLTDNDWKLLNQKYDDMNYVIDKLNSNYPVQYLIGNVDFYGYEIMVDERVLIPRFETEGLLELTINYIHEKRIENAKVLDIGTGSGCIPIVLKKEIPTLDITSIDISNDALEVARYNIKKHQVDINLVNQSIFNYKSNELYDVIISNPPYISYDEQIDPKTKYEPQNALYANDDGLEFYKYIIDNAKDMLNDKFIIAFEIGYLQGDRLISYSKNIFPNAKIFVKKDLAEKDRYFFIINE